MTMQKKGVITNIDNCMNDLIALLFRWCQKSVQQC